MLPIRWNRALVLSILLAACGERSPTDLDTGMPREPAPARVAASVTSTGLVWLSPTVREVAPFVGPFEGNHRPVIRVVCIGSTDPACPEIARFDERSSGPAKVTVDLREESYKSNWHTPESLALGRGQYRVEVWLHDALVGAADLLVVRTRQEAMAAPVGALAVVRGQPFLIKFRLETWDFDQLPGAADFPAVEAIPAQVPTTDLTEFSTANPRLPGLPLSVSTVLVVLDPSATLERLNALLREFRARVIGGVPGRGGQSPGTIVLRLPTTTPEAMNAQRDLLRGRPEVMAATPDHLVATSSVPRPNGGTPPLYTWNVVAPAGSNWGLEAVRAPALWNLNDWITKHGARPRTLVYDAGFVAFHEDLSPEAWLGDSVVNDHGTHVAGIIGADFDNGVGVDGVNPFARLVLATHAPGWAAILADLCAVLQTPVPPAVINVSLGYSWRATGIDPTTNTAAQQQAIDDGLTFQACLQTAAANGALLPVITAAAGNDASDGTWGSPLTAAALIHQAAPIIVVEALKLTGPVVSRAEAFSNYNGHVAAPGAAITSTVSGGYAEKSGTSMAAPLVAGVAGYLLALEPNLRPTMQVNPVLDLLRQTARYFLVGAPHVDAFSAALQLDRRRGTTAVLRGLVDVDDGSSDGNRRVTADGVPVTAEDADGDGGRGDGTVDMSDFRRWRDWLLQAENGPDLALDGAANHPKKDLNGDGVVASAAEENVHPRGDFNGDGIISRTATRPMHGLLGGPLDPLPATDLAVLRAVFTDPIYDEAELPSLLDSGDITVDIGSCVDLPRAAEVAIAIQRNSDTSQVVREERVGTASRQVVLTVPAEPSGYAIRVAVLDGGNIVIATRATRDSVVRIGGDVHYDAACTEPTEPLSLTGGALPRAIIGQPYTAQAIASGGPDAPKTFSVLSGALPPGLGLNPTTGVISGTPGPPGMVYGFTLQVQAGGETATASFSIEVTASGTGDPWIGNYLGSGTLGGSTVTVAMSFVSYSATRGAYTATLRVIDGTGQTLYASNSCSVFGPPTVTSTFGSCGAVILNVQRGTTTVAGEILRRITGTATDIPVTPDGSIRSPLTFSVTER